MADWTNITDTAVDPDAPLTSQLGYAWRDNPIAIAEGAADAPRIQPGAMQTYVGRVILTTATTPVEITDLNPETVIAFVGSFVNGSANASYIQVSGSSDNGGSWGAWETITANADGRNPISGAINLKSGACDTIYSVGDLGNDINAIRFAQGTTLSGTGNQPARISVYSVGLAP